MKPRQILDHGQWAAQLAQELPTLVASMSPDTLAVLDAVLTNKLGRSTADEILGAVDSSLASATGLPATKAAPPPREFASADEVPPYLNAFLRTRSGAIYGRVHPSAQKWWRLATAEEPADLAGFAEDGPIGLADLPVDEWPVTERFL